MVLELQEGKNSRLTTPWGVMETAKKILESGGWNQTDPFRWRLASQEEQERWENELASSTIITNVYWLHFIFFRPLKCQVHQDH